MKHLPISVISIVVLSVTFLSLYCNAIPSTGTVKRDKIGKIHFFYPYGNSVLADRNKRIAAVLNSYCRKNASANFSNVLLYLYDQDASSPMMDIDEVLVGYEQYEGELISRDKIFWNVKGPVVSISVAVAENHLERSMAALEYAVKNINELKKREQALSAKAKTNQLTEEDRELFKLE